MASDMLPVNAAAVGLSCTFRDETVVGLDMGDAGMCNNKCKHTFNSGEAVTLATVLGRFPHRPEVDGAIEVVLLELLVKVIDEALTPMAAVPCNSGSTSLCDSVDVAADCLLNCLRSNASLA